MRPTGIERERLLARVAARPWVHVIDLGDGVSTPGTWLQPNPALVRAMDSVDFRGKKVLDIGCWDGLWSFEAERRGAAQVYATDLVTQRRWGEESTLLLAKQILGSRVEYHPDLSVYDVERLGVRDFDVVIYPGVYYHLKDPVLSFTRLRRVMKEGATLIVEGAVVEDAGCSARFFYREPYLGDLSNWWVPTVDCLRQWVECGFFEGVEEFGFWDAGGHNLRYTLTARAVRRADPLYIRPPEELGGYDLNAYPQTFLDRGGVSAGRAVASTIRRLAVHVPASLKQGPHARLLRRVVRRLDA
jgi:tRNA (mo5U34)-methyltransferase